jgi:hypothetical protein
MRFFTKEWLSGQLTDEAFEAVPTEYRLHLAALRLPHAVLALAEVNIHDGLMLDVEYEPQPAKLMLRLRCGDLQRGYCDLTVNYSAAALDPVSLSILRDAMRDPKDELLYDEVDRVGDRFEHRLILSSHKEVCVRFAAVAVSSQSVGGREAV